ncbi:cytochrome P460 family protein [Methylococcus sp. EFPC2]|nr:cytochrome P460 family protein [Methylococcus sp. EFPC2]
MLTALLTATPAGAEPPPASPNGIIQPEGYQNWRLISVSQRTESQTLRAILGNSVAVEAARAGKTNPWPNGTILAKVNLKQKNSETFPTAIVPSELIHVDFMIKDDSRYASTNGWGWARWMGQERKPYGQDANFSQECIACHSAVKGQDMVFTKPVILP